MTTPWRRSCVRAGKRKAGVDHATQYARAVVGGEIVAGKWVRLACARHLRDLEDGAKRGLRWEPVRAERVFAFFRCLRLDRKSTRLNSSHSQISYAVLCLKKIIH